jgi:hypothetical protein
LVRRGGEENWEIWVENTRQLVERVGHDLVAAFLKCFEGVGRVHSLEQLMYFNLKALGEDAVPYDRNLRALILLLGSTMYELGDALQQLCDAKVATKMNDRSAWHPLNELRGKWRGDGRLAKLRNTFGFHLGDLDLYRAGLAAWLVKADDHLFERGEGSKRHGGEFMLSFNTLLEGADVNDAWWQAVIELTQEAHTELPEQLHAVWLEVLRTAGITFESE